MSNRRPDFIVGAMNTSTQEKNSQIGAAWKNADGSISVRLNDFVQLNGGKNLSLRLWPVPEKLAHQSTSVTEPTFSGDPF